jgi:signal transduction histidine kinase
MIDEPVGGPELTEQARQLIAQISLQTERSIQHVLRRSWDVSDDDVGNGVHAYVEALVRSVETARCDYLETYIHSLDPLWRNDQFAISPLISAMFIIQDAAIELWPRVDEEDAAFRCGLIEHYSRRAIECLSERSVKLALGQLERQVQDHREGEARLMSLQRVGAALVSDLDLDRSLQLIADEARRMIGADGVVIRMADEAGDLEFMTGSGNERLIMRTTRLPGTLSLSGEALRSGSPICVDDIRTDPRVNPKYLNVSNSRSLLIVPLISRDRPVGVITGTSVAYAAFTDQDITILSLFADQAASAIENARLFQQAQAQIAELEALHRVSQLVSSSLDLEEVFQTLYEEVARLMPADAFLVALARPDGLHDFEFIIDSGQRYPPRRGLQLSAILSEKLDFGEMVILRDVTDHPQYSRANRFGDTDNQTRSVLAAPLMRRDQVIGMISAQSYKEHDYRDPEARMLRTIASQAAIAIEHARLYRQAQNVAIAEERARLAREIHDTLAQGLIGVILCLERLDLAVPSEDAYYRPWIERALELSRSSLDEARRSVRDLRAAPLEGRTLVEAIANLVADVRDSHPFEVISRLPASLPPLSARVETALFRVAQEAISNAGKHSGCQRLWVDLEIAESSITLRVSDDGDGFVPDQNWEPTEHYGLATMRERIVQIGGRIEIESSPGNGAVVRVDVPASLAMHRESSEADGSDSAYRSS